MGIDIIPGRKQFDESNAPQIYLKVPSNDSNFGYALRKLDLPREARLEIMDNLPDHREINNSGFVYNLEAEGDVASFRDRLSVAFEDGPIAFNHFNQINFAVDQVERRVFGAPQTTHEPGC